ncbi:hypothetical protein Bhyg_03320, partial [Pseudolycoriella hygida]
NEKSSIDYLKGDSFESVSDVVSHWKITHDYRQDLIKDKKSILQDILSQWKCLEFPFSHILICQDYKDIFGVESAASLRRNWIAFFDENRMEILRSKVKDKTTLRTVTELPATDGIS